MHTRHLTASPKYFLYDRDFCKYWPAMLPSRGLRLSNQAIGAGRRRLNVATTRSVSLLYTFENFADDLLL